MLMLDLEMSKLQCPAEGGALPRRQHSKKTWAMPLVRFQQHGQSPYEGRSPIESYESDGEAEPRLTSGGVAASRN